jgi:hypothetical protein
MAIVGPSACPLRQARIESTPAVRQALETLLGARLTFSPGPEGYTFSGPGRFFPEAQPPPEAPDDPVKIIRAQNEADGLHLCARTAMPGWLGEPLDVGWAIDVLHPLAR